MNENMQSSPELGYSIENSDAKYVSGLSTILVATIQEAKDRISQIEYIFCSQLYPNFQTKSKNIQKVYSDARKCAEKEWKEKESELLLEIQKLQIDKQNSIEENQSLKLEMEEKVMQEVNSFFAKQTNLENRIVELEQELRLRLKEVDEGMVMQNKLLHLVQSKSTVVLEKGRELKENKGKTTVLLSELNDLEKKVNELQEQLREKSKEVVNGNELIEDLLKKIESQDSKIVNNEEKIDRFEKELRKKSEEILNQQIHLTNSEIIKMEQKLKDNEEEKKIFLTKVRSLEEKIEELQVELESEKNIRRNNIVAFKRLKSQHNYLRAKYGLTAENTPMELKLEEGNDSLSHNHNATNLPNNENENSDTNTTTLNKNASSKEKLGNEKGLKSGQISNSHSPTFVPPGTSKQRPSEKSAPLSGIKRPASHWRDTRAHQRQGGPDPHDDFLDTPLENIKENITKTAKEQQQQAQQVQTFSDDETQDLNPGCSYPTQHKQQIPAPNNPTTKGYKYVEPVRKKLERENLKGVECNQCKKFYDAVLPDNGDGNKSLRCEHHDGVSRHRYRYVPPMTPEGFWNIGFDSEM